MNNKNLFTKIVFVALIIIIAISLLAPAIFGQAMPAPRQEKLLNGLKVLMWPNTPSNKVTVKLRIHSGSAFDPQGKEGVMKLLAENIFPSSESRNFFAEDLGGGLKIDSNYDFIQIDATSDPSQALELLETIAAAVSNPAIDRETTANLKKSILEKLGVLEKNPAYLADRASAERLFGTFPYGRPELGTTRSISAIEYPDLIDARLRFLTADNATLAVTGKFDRNLIYRAIRRYFGGWTKSDRRVPSTFRQPDAPDVKPLEKIYLGTGSSEVRYSFRGIARNDKDLASSKILARIIRDRVEKMTNRSNVYVSSNSHRLPGSFTVKYNGSNASDGLIERAFAGKITDAEFSKSKTDVISALTEYDLANHWLDVDTFGISSVADTVGSYQKADLADVQRVADLLSRNPVVTVILSPKGEPAASTVK
ncbi:MAG: insulinase family protein [Pyrinomonadaceae bacterium]